MTVTKFTEQPTNKEIIKKINDIVEEIGDIETILHNINSGS